MSQPKGLGKGFEALIPTDFDSSLLVDEQDRVQKLLITDVFPAKDQPRTTIDEQGLKELASSIKQHGILQPIIVQIRDDGKTYLIVAGERRWRAAQQAGLTHVPAIVRTLEELERLEIALIENVQRSDLPLLDQALAIRRLFDQFNVGYADIATRLGKGQSTIMNIARLVDLPPEAKKALNNSQITEGHARSVLALKDMPDKQADLLQLIIKNHWTVRQAEQFVIAAKKQGKDTAKARQRLATTTPATERLATRLGTPVSLRRLAKGGKIEIGFANDSQLSLILRRLSKK